ANGIAGRRDFAPERIAGFRSDVPTRTSGARRPRNMPLAALRKNRLRGIPFPRNCAIVAADGAGITRDRTACFRVYGAVCPASTQRKENYGYCQESKENREEARREKGPRNETCGEESHGEAG